MKGFERKDRLFSLCGLNCGLCPMKLDGHCPGCGGGAGNQSCKIAKCSLEHGGPAYCTDCAAYPCVSCGTGGKAPTASNAPCTVQRWAEEKPFLYCR